MSVLLKVENLQAWYGKQLALNGVDLTIDTGQIVWLLGRNGAGKSTLISSICGALKPAPSKSDSIFGARVKRPAMLRIEGQIGFEGVSLVGAPADKIAKMGIGLVPEGRRVFSNLTVEQNLTAAASFGALKGIWTLERVYDMFPQLQDLAGQEASVLSGGEQQILAISRALLTNPKLLILDEATEGLAPVSRQHIWRAVETLKAEGMSILIVDKILKKLFKTSDQCVVLEQGRNLWSGKPSDVPAEIADEYLDS